MSKFSIVRRLVYDLCKKYHYEGNDLVSHSEAVEFLEYFDNIIAEIFCVILSEEVSDVKQEENDSKES